MKRVFLVLSAAAFFCLQIQQSTDAIGVAVAIPFLIFFALKKPQLAEPRKLCVCGKAFCALTAAGVCLWPIDGYAGWLRSITVFQNLQGFFGVEPILLSQIAAAAFAVVGFLFVYQMVCLFTERFLAVAREAAADFSKAEGVAAAAAALVLAAAVVAVYANTDAFASPVVTRDLIYTADSGAIVHGGAYFSPNAVENDFRSPLFALFAAPLLGLPYLIGRMLPFSDAVAAALVAAQVPLLVASFCLLTKMIRGVGKAARVLLPLAMLTTYCGLLFTVMAEQYVVALFYLSLCLYVLAERGKREQWLVLGAAGAMIPGAALAFVPERAGKPKKEIVRDGLISALWGVALMLASGCFNLVLRSPEDVSFFVRFSGFSVPFADRMLQFFSYVARIFAAPQAGGVLAADGYWKWRIAETGGVNVFGVLMLALACAGFALNRRQAFAKISMGWVGLSALLLCVLGWGTAEKGLTLYTLYFGWAYAALLIYLAESALKALKLSRFSWVAYALGAAALLCYNLPRMGELIRFAIAHYPV